MFKNFRVEDLENPITEESIAFAAETDDCVERFKASMRSFDNEVAKIKF